MMDNLFLKVIDKMLQIRVKNFESELEFGGIKELIEFNNSLHSINSLILGIRVQTNALAIVADTGLVAKACAV